MGVQYIGYTWDGLYTGDNGYSVSNQYNFVPVNAMAQSSLAGLEGIGMGAPTTGFSAYVSRPQPNGADINHAVPGIWNGGGFVGYQPIVSDPNLVSVTWVLDGNVVEGCMVASLLLVVYDYD